MYVIGRAVHEQVQIGNTISIKILRIGSRDVTLGIEVPKGVPVSHERKTTPETSLVSPDGGVLNVLIVDDTPIHTWLVQKAFNAYGANRTRVARTGKEALVVLGIETQTPAEMSCYDLIVMDLRLPDMPGLELIRRVRSDPHRRLVPIVVMTYQDADTELLRCLEAGANAFVPKPETQEGFRQAVFRIADFWSHARRVPASSSAHPAQELVC